MVEFLGLIKVLIIRGINLAVRDVLSSDPYVVLTLGHQVNLHSPLFFHLFYCFLHSTLNFFFPDNEDEGYKEKPKPSLE